MEKERVTVQCKFYTHCWGFPPFPAHPSLAPQHLEVEVLWSGVYRWMSQQVVSISTASWDRFDIPVDGFFFLAPGSMWSNFFLC